jgi:hypothetical protein
MCIDPSVTFRFRWMVQGLHDIASVLLMAVGEGMAYRLLGHLTNCQLRDCTRCRLPTE